MYFSSPQSLRAKSPLKQIAFAHLVQPRAYVWGAFSDITRCPCVRPENRSQLMLWISVVSQWQDLKWLQNPTKMGQIYWWNSSPRNPCSLSSQAKAHTKSSPRGKAIRYCRFSKFGYYPERVRTRREGWDCWPRTEGLHDLFGRSQKVWRNERHLQCSSKRKS